MSPPAPACTCGGQDVHSLHCLAVAATQPHAMINDSGEVFYPDNADDADFFAREHGARPVTATAW